MNDDIMMVTKEVNIPIPALNDTATLAHVTAYREAEGVYVYDLYNADNLLIAKSRYGLIGAAPFELTEADIEILNTPPPVDPEAPEV